MSRRRSPRSKSLAALVFPIAGAIAACQHPALAASIDAAWTGAGGNTSYAISANWNPVGAPVNDASNTYNVSIPNNIAVVYDVDGLQSVTDLVLGTGTTFTVAPGKSLTVLDDAKIGGFLIVDTASFTATAPAAQFTGNTARLQASGGGSLTLAATSYSAAGLNAANYTLLSATGAGTSINLASLQAIDDSFNDGWGGVRTHAISALHSASINLSNVQTITTPTRAEDRLEIVSSDSASIDLSSLKSVTGAGQLLFTSDTLTYSLPALTSASNLAFNMAPNSTLSLPALTTLNGSNIYFANNQTINAPSFITFTNSLLTLGPTNTLNAPAFTTIDNSRVLLSSGASLAVAAPSYSATALTGAYTLFSASGANTVLDLSSVKSFNDRWDDGWGGVQTHTISATNSASINLSGLQTITGPARAEDRLDFVINSGGSMDLSTLQTITGSGQVRFLTDAPSFSLPALSAASGLAIITGPSCTVNLPALVTADRTALNVGENGSINAASLKTLAASSISLGTGGTLNAPTLVSFTNSTLTLGSGQTLTAPAFSNINDSRLVLSGGITYAVAATNYSATGIPGNYTLFDASGSNTLLDLTALSSFNDRWDDAWGGVQAHTITATSGATIDLSHVSTITSPTRAEDRLDLIANSGGSIKLDNLQSITGSGQLRIVTDAPSLTLPALGVASGLSFAMNAGSSLSLPVLVSADRASLSVPNAATFAMPALITLTNSSIDIGNGGAFNAPNLKTFTSSALTLGAAQTLNAPAFTSIHNSRFTINGGVYFAVGVPDYSATALPENYTLLNASGTNTVLDFSSLTSLNDAWNDNWGGVQVHTITATGGATINLSNVNTITTPARAEDRLDLVTSAGGTINLSKLKVVPGNGQLRFVTDAPTLALPALATAAGLSFAMNPGSTLNLPLLLNADRTAITVPDSGFVNANVLKSLTNSSVSIGAGGAFNAPALTSFTNNSLTLGANQTLNAPLFTNVDGSRFTLTSGAVYAVAAPAYSAAAVNAAATLFSASGTATLLDLSSLLAINDSWNDNWGGVQTHTISAAAAATIDLSNVQSITTPVQATDRLDFTADSNAFIDLSSLSSITGPGQARFTIGSGASIRVGDLKAAQNTSVALSDLTSSFRSIGSLFLGANSLSAASGSKITVGRHFSHSNTDETRISTASATLQLLGPGNQYLEVAGKDSGLPSDALPAHNFAIGQLVVGSDDQPSVVQLLDVVDNGNRAGSAGNAEALYLPGLGGPDGLVLKPGSTLVLGSINVYYRQGATWKKLNDLLSTAGPIPVGNAYISSSAELIPGAWNLDDNGSWSPDDNWLVRAPNKLGDAAYFGNKATAPRTVTVDSPKLLGAINFDNAAAYTIAGSAPITLHVAGDTRASITANNRNGNAAHTLAAPLILNSPLLVSQNSAGALSLAGPLDNSSAQRITKIGPGLLAISGPQTHAPGAELFVEEGPLNLDSDAGSSAALNLNVLVKNGSRTTLGSTQHLASLKLAASSAAFTIGGDKVLVTPQLAVDPASTLDLADNDLVVQADSTTRAQVLAQLTALIKSARNSKLGLWRGFGITSSAALNDTTNLTGLAVSLNDKGDGSGPLFSLFDGQPVNLNSALVKYTWNGDANLDGLVNADDYFLVDSGFLTQIGGYRNGDFNYDAVVNADDYFLIDSAFLGQKSKLSLAAVPEPTALALLALSSLALLPHRRRRRP